MKNIWFWATFSLWIFLGITVTAWPLIYSPFQLNKIKISDFDVETNGIKQQHQIWISSSSIETCENQLNKEWEKEGWRQITGNWDLTPYLLGIERNNSLLLDYLRVKLFQKENHLKILGLWNKIRGSQTYCWIAEIPISRLREHQISASASFPLSPPSEAINIYLGKTKNLQLAYWTLPPHPYPEEKFKELFLSQGFDGRLWDKRPAETTYLLEKGSVRIIAVLKSEAKKRAISLVLFSKK